MTPARHHAEWLSLIESSGPFLSMPVLLRVFPQGLEQRDAAKASELREAYEDWLERGATQPAVHHAWIRHVLTELLEYPPEFLVEGQAIPPGMEAVMANYGETLRPDYVLLGRSSPSPPAAGGEGRGEVGASDQQPSRRPLLLLEHYEPSQDLEKPVAGKTWKASPGTRMMELLHAADVPLGLVTNGEQWMIVAAPRGETTGFASWYADLWMQEPITLRAFHSVLHLRRFMGVAEPETLAALYAESSKDQQEVTEQLGYQVRQAVEMLVQAFDRMDAESGRTLLAGVSEKTLYDGALTVMMRLVFLFSADERGLLLLGDPLYDQNYAVSTLSELLRERADQHGEEVLERRHDAWCRLLATFRAVHGGVDHEAMRLPPYSGTLFDPDRYPFLEGRAAETRWRTTPAKPLPINNRVVLHLLEALQVLRVRVPGGGPAEARRLSFRALDIEQIGHVYEGLLDHTARRAGETILGLAGSKNREPEITLSKLEEVAGKGPVALIEFLKEETGRSESTLRKALQSSVPADVTSPASNPPRKSQSLRTSAATSTIDDHALLIACGQDPLLAKRVRPFAALLRPDTFGQFVVVGEGSVYVTAGSDRRSTGTHYTPRSLTEPIVQHTLEPLVYTGPAEGKPKAEWQLKSPREILALKVCDMAMGSGAFLVQVCRYLGERLVEAWENAERELAGEKVGKRESEKNPATTPDGSSPTFPPAHPLTFTVLPDGSLSLGSSTERLLPADPAERLAIARRYVADRCLYGVDINPMAVEMAKLSLWLITLQRDRPFTFLDHALKCGDSLLGVSSVQQIENFSLRPGERQVTFATANLFRYVDEASAKRRALEDLPSNDHTQIETKNRLHAEAEAATAKVKAVADCLIAFELRGLDGDPYEDQRTEEAEKVQLLMKRDADASLKSAISNFQSALATHAREQLRGRRPFHWAVEFPEVFARDGFDAFVGNPPFITGTAISTNLGVEYKQHLKQLWPHIEGRADLCVVFMLRAGVLCRLKGVLGLVGSNTTSETDSRITGPAYLLANGFSLFRAIKSMPWPGSAAVFICHAHFYHGDWSGRFFLDGNEVDRIDSSFTPFRETAEPFTLIASKEKSFTGTKVYGNGFVVSPQEAEDIICREPLCRDVIKPYLIGKELNDDPACRPARFIIDFTGLSASEAQRYGGAWRIADERVREERQSAPEPRMREVWWQFQRPRTELYGKLRELGFAWVVAATSDTLAFVGIPYSQEQPVVFSHAVNVLTLLGFGEFAVVQGSLHLTWARRYGSSLKGDFRYTTTDCFENFPLPTDSSSACAMGQRYHEFRREIMETRQEGLTKTYNRFHDRGEKSEDIARLRALHEEMDQAVAAAYGWSDLAGSSGSQLSHGFHATKQGERYTLSEPARRTVLDRLLQLNHQRYEEELKAGLHDKGAKKAKKPKGIAVGSQGELIKPPQQELFE